MFHSAQQIYYPVTESLLMSSVHVPNLLVASVLKEYVRQTEHPKPWNVEDETLAALVFAGLPVLIPKVHWPYEQSTVIAIQMSCFLSEEETYHFAAESRPLSLHSLTACRSSTASSVSCCGVKSVSLSRSWLRVNIDDI